ncbi:MAG: GNAT family N-acetyltransferase, partial [Micromonosporaceae bacterium]
PGPASGSAHTVLVQTASLSTVRAALPDASDLPPVRIAARPDDDWLGVVASRKWGLPEAGIAVLTGPPLTGFASVYDSGVLVATGRGVVTDGWLGLTLVEVSPSARRRGLARHVVAGLVTWATRHRAERGYLQVEQHNDAALGLYGELGFATHHTYVYRVAP